MKPIEPGCVAIVHGLRRDTSYNGLSVRVEGLVRHGERFIDEAGSLVVFMDSEGWLCSRQGWLGHAAFSARNLLRIDGGDDERVTESQDMEARA